LHVTLKVPPEQVQEHDPLPPDSQGGAAKLVVAKAKPRKVRRERIATEIMGLRIINLL
jgi:hypothetical protein